MRATRSSIRSARNDWQATSPNAKICKIKWKGPRTASTLHRLLFLKNFSPGGNGQKATKGPDFRHENKQENCSHELPGVLRAGVLHEEIRPVNHEPIGQQIHDATAQAQRLNPAKTLAEHGAGAARPQPEEAQGGRGNAHWNARPCCVGGGIAGEVAA